MTDSQGPSQTPMDLLRLGDDQLPRTFSDWAMTNCHMDRLRLPWTFSDWAMTDSHIDIRRLPWTFSDGVMSDSHGRSQTG